MKKVNQNIYIGLVIYAFLIFFWLQSTGLPNESVTMPRMVLTLIAILNTIVFVNGIQRTIRKDTSGQTKNTLQGLKGPAIIALVMIGYAILFTFLGYYIATPIVFVGMLLIYRYRKAKHLVIVTAAFELFVYILFSLVLHIPLP